MRFELFPIFEEFSKCWQSFFLSVFFIVMTVADTNREVNCSGIGGWDETYKDFNFLRLTFPLPTITFISHHVKFNRPKLGTLHRRDGMVQRLWQKWSRF